MIHLFKILRLKIVSRTLAIFILLNVLGSIIYPSLTYAMLTNGPSQPEISGYQAGGSSDNVNLVTGGFHYDIPITSIPEYPMSIGYSSGLGMDDEASSFGFGFNGFSGAINRNVMGLPDDISGQTKRYKYENDINWDVSSGATLTAGYGVSVGVASVGVNASVSFTAGYNNYTGCYGIIGYGLGVGAQLKGLASAGVGVNVANDSRADGVSGGIGINAELFGAIGVGISKSFNSSKIDAYLSFSTPGDGVGSSSTIALDFGNNSFSSANGTSASYLSPLSNVIATANSTGIDLSVTIPLPIGLSGAYLSVTVDAAYSQFSYGNQDIPKTAYGFLYLGDYDRSSTDQISDMTIEGEDPFTDANRSNPVYLQRDFFNVNAGGLSGGMQFVSQDYGIFSRNKSRQNVLQVQLPVLLTHTERTEVFPWYNVTKAVRNDDFDILSFLKKDPNNESSSDFDNTMFKDEELESFNGTTNANQKFKASASTTRKMKLRFRGDMAGDFNLGSRNTTDFDPLKFNTVNVGDQSGDKRLVFLGYIKDMPMAKLEATKTDGSAFTPNESPDAPAEIKSASRIDYYTIGDVVDATGNELKNAIPNALTIESIYGHYKLGGTITYTNNTADNANNGVTKTPFSIIQDLVTTYTTVNQKKLIADIRVTKTDGSKYIFNLPAFAKNSKQISLSGNKAVAPQRNGEDDYTTASNSNRNKSTITEDYPYPYAWMLTAILGHDYIDLDNIPGPSEGDLGYWVKFKYLKVADNYRWKSPYVGMEHSPGALQLADDDIYSVASGEKEIYYLESVESKNHIAKYSYVKRHDGIAAKALVNADAINSQTHAISNLLSGGDITDFNSLGNGSYQFKVDAIDLYNKHPYANQSQTMSNTTNDFNGKKIKSTKFTYDYSTSNNLPNNNNTYDNSSNDKGKLTLKKVQHVAYDDAGASVSLPSYEFNYSSTNPGYDPHQRDGWGNYNADAGAADGSGATLYSNYETTSKSIADDNAEAFALNTIELPTGGTMTVDYEAGGYSQVQDKKAFVMRRINSISQNSGNTILNIDVTDLVNPTTSASSLGDILKVNDKLYGEVTFYQSSNHVNGNRDKYIVNEQEYEQEFNTNLEVVNIGAVSLIGNKYYQAVTVKLKSSNVVPFYTKFETFLYKKSDLYNLYLSGVNPNEKDTPLDAAKKMIKNFRRLFDDVSDLQKNGFLSYANPGNPAVSYNSTTRAHFANYAIISQYSYLRTPVYKEKFTGSRVKSITLSDEFQLSTSTANEGRNQYKTNYFYDSNGDGSGVSSGVATIEPMGGPSSVIDIHKTKGIGFYASPAIFYGKVTVETGYDAPSNSKFPRKKGKTQYQFYTPGDAYDGELKLKFEDNFKALDAKDATVKTVNSQFYLYGILSWLKISFKIFTKKITISIPIPLPLFVDWQRWDDYHGNSYAYTDVTDLYGRPKKISQIDASGKEVSYQKFNYTGKTESVSVIDGTISSGSDPYTNSNAQFSMRPGRVDQIWSEAYYTKDTKVDFISPILYMKATTNRHFNLINMKQVYMPPILKSIETGNTLENFKDTTTYTKYDYWTGQPLETQTRDGNGNIKITRTVPAYWKYSAMWPANGQSLTYNIGSTTANRLTEDAASYEYLGTVSNTSLLAANASQWTSGVNYETSLMVDAYINSATSKQYDYFNIPVTDLKDLYANVKTRISRDGYYGKSPFQANDFIKNDAEVLKPIKSYVFKADLTDATKGTFTLSDFNFDPTATLNSGWKLQQEQTLFSKEGDAVETRNILNQYSSQRMGYNGQNTVATASNAKQAEMIYDGGENTYTTQAGTVTDNSDLILDKAEIKTTNDPAFIYSYSLPSTTLVKPNANAVIIDVNTPSDNTDRIIGRIKNLGFTDVNHSKELFHRTILICKDRNNELFLMTNQGEPFNGGYILKGGLVNGLLNFKLAIDKRFMTFIPASADIEILYSGSQISVSGETGLESCGNPLDKTYSLINEAVVPHTGKYVFCVNTEGKGTRYQIPAASVAASRKYSAMVWVHNSSSPQTVLVIKSGSTTVERTVTDLLNTDAGNWKLLRANIDATAGNMVEAYIENKGGGRSVYDDFRVQPLDAKMEATVYDHQFGRVCAKLNNENLATWYTYDPRGRLIEVKSEVQNTGPVTVKRYQYKEQKAD